METSSFVELRIDSLRIGLPLAAVERVLRAAEVTPVPGAQSCLHGMLDVRGEPVPVYDTRRLLGLPSRELRPEDRFVLARGRRGRGIFVADDVPGTVECAAAVPPAGFAALSAGVRGVTADREGLLFVQDLDRFLFLERAIPLQTDG